MGLKVDLAVEVGFVGMWCMLVVGRGYALKAPQKHEAPGRLSM